MPRKKPYRPGQPILIRGKGSTIEDLLLKYIQKDDVTECWEFTGTLRHKRDGYGRIRRRTRTIRWYAYAHRFSYEWFRGPIPEAFTIDHLCRNVNCVNPWHMEVVTRAENTRRKVDRAMTLIEIRAINMGTR